MSRISLFICCLLLFAYLNGNTQVPLSSSYRFVIKPYVQWVTDSSFYILWETSAPGKGIVLLTEMETNSIRPALKTVATETGSNLMHEMAVTGLHKGNSYYYQVLCVNQAGDTLQGPLTAIRIPDYDRQPVTFAVVGDTQNYPLVWGRIAQLIARERPTFLLHVGDLVQYGPHKDDWTEEFFKPAADLFSHYPIYPTIGNHEMQHPYYFQYFHLGGDEYFYTVKKGNVLLIFIDTNKDILPGSRQYKMLEEVLASSRETWKIVLHHHPIYVSFEETNSMKLPEGDLNIIHLRQLYEDYGVDVVLNGHMHQYERTEPIFREKIDREKGVVYITTGGGGGTLDVPSTERRWFDAKIRSVHHFVSFNILGNTLQAQVIDSSGQMFDTWEKTKTVSTSNPLVMTAKRPHFMDSTTVILQNKGATGAIVYQAGYEKKYQVSSEKEIRIPMRNTTTITAFIKDGPKGTASRPVQKTFSKLPVFPAQKTAGKTPVRATYHEDVFLRLPDFNLLQPLRSFTGDSLTLNLINPRRKDHWAARFTGRFTSPATAVYRLLLESYDGSKLLIDGKEVINNDGMHYEILMDTYIALEKGEHTFEVQYFDFTRRETLRLWMGTQEGEMMDFNNYIIR